MDLTYEEWKVLAPLLGTPPLSARRGGRPWHDRQEVQKRYPVDLTPEADPPLE